jgi:Zn-dependent protease
LPFTPFNSVELIFFCVGILVAVTAQGAAQGLAIEIFRTRKEDEDQKPQLNLNAFAHLDPLALVAFFLGGFGWARPSRVEDDEFKNPRLAWLVIAFVSALTNLFVAVTLSSVSDILGKSQVLSRVMAVNAAVFVYQYLIPIFPLAASRVIYALTPARFGRLWLWYARLGPFLLVALTGIERFLGIPLLRPLTQPAIDAIMRFCS